MSKLTIRTLDPEGKERLRVRAAQRGHCIEEEARRILSETCGPLAQGENLADIARRLFGEGHEVELPKRRTGREPPRFA